jgi:uncharacterized protein (DUF1697 family)
VTHVTYVALLRGINVGRAKRVAMADLRALVSALGYRDVRTLLNSGNVIFAGPRAQPSSVAAAIEAALTLQLGVAAKVIVLTASELAAAAAANPLPGAETNPSRILLAFPANPKDTGRLRPLLTEEWSPEALAVGPRAAYLWCPDGVIASRIAAAVGRALADSVTMRNWATVAKLVELSGG